MYGKLNDDICQDEALWIELREALIRFDNKSGEL